MSEAICGAAVPGLRLRSIRRFSLNTCEIFLRAHASPQRCGGNI
jgi:hypothetical protein